MSRFVGYVSIRPAIEFEDVHLMENAIVNTAS
jgi:hypothetical protein